MFKQIVNRLLKSQGSFFLAGLWWFTSLYYLYLSLKNFLFPISVPSVTIQQPPLISPSLIQEGTLTVYPLIPPSPQIGGTIIPQPKLEILLTDILIAFLFLSFGVFTAGLYIPKRFQKLVIAILSVILSTELHPLWESLMGTSSELFSPAGILVSILFAIWSRSYILTLLVASFSTALAVPFLHLSYQIRQIVEQGFFEYWIPTLSNVDFGGLLSFLPSVIPLLVIFSFPALLAVFLAQHWQKISNLPILSKRLVRYLFVLTLMSPLIYIFILEPLLSRYNQPPIPPTLPPDIPKSTRGLSPEPQPKKDYVIYTAEELRRNTTIYFKFKSVDMERLDLVFSDMQKVIKSFPGYKYDRMSFTLTAPSYSMDGGYEVNVEGDGHIEKGRDHYSFSYILKENNLTRVGFTTARQAIPNSVKTLTINSIKLDEDFQEFSTKNPDIQPSFSWYENSETPNIGEFITIPKINSFVVTTFRRPCEGNIGWSCENDQYTILYDIFADRLIKAGCYANNCNFSCGEGLVRDYGLVCSVGRICCISLPQ
ncbi:MAG: hypothetical protein FJ044_04410 [Candidatus Cloacimonetes bacterium]|nr:hypothetical protein [Candidatus Cloacimonadota bacterium]